MSAVADADPFAAAHIPRRGGATKPDRGRRPCKCPHLGRQVDAADVGVGGRHAALPMGSFDRPRRLWHAEWHLSAAANGKDVVLEGVLQLAHATLDLFHGGYAIHGSYEIHRLGGPASHGCIRLHPANAATLFALVKQRGMGDTTIVVSGGHRSW